LDHPQNTTGLPGNRSNLRPTILGSVMILILILLSNANNEMTRADSDGCLLTSHTLIHAGNLQLDDYPELAPVDNYKFMEMDGHVFYALSFGTSVLCAPVVGLYELLGFSVLDRASEAHLQRLLAAMIVMAMFYMAYKLFSLRLGFTSAVIVALVFTLGTSFTSTLGTALWNTGLESVALLAAVYLVARHQITGKDIQPELLGALLGLAYFCRPSALWPDFLLVLYVALYARAQLMRVLLGGGFWVVLLLLISQVEYGQWIPPYYKAVIQEQQWHPVLVLKGLTISPGRGILIFSPFLGLILLWLIFRAGHLRRNPLLWGALAGFIFHVLFMVRHIHWWGGTCFGARLLTDAVVALMPGVLVVAEDWLKINHKLLKRTLAALFLVLGICSIWIHSGQGLFNRHTLAWNAQPSIESNVVWSVFDWRFPQFLASEKRLQDRMMTWGMPSLKTLAPKAIIAPDSEDLIYIGWKGYQKKPDGDVYRWSNGPKPSLGIRLDSNISEANFLELHLGCVGTRTIEVLFNGHAVGEFEVTGTQAQIGKFVIPAARLLDPTYGQQGHLISLNVGPGIDPKLNSKPATVVLRGVFWETSPPQDTGK